MIRKTSFPTFSAALIAAGALTVAPAAAQKAAAFYKGRTVTIVVPVSAGGVYGTFATILERHFRNHVPGRANVIVQYMPGAGGMKALNYAYNAGPRDGTLAVTPTTGVVTTPVLRPGSVKYDPGKFEYLGGWGESVNTLTVMTTSKVKTLQDAMKIEIPLGSVGRGTSSYQIPALLNELLGTKFKIITGYRGGTPIRLAMEKGEVDGWSGLWLGWKSAKPEWVREGKLRHLLQMASKRQKDLADVPLLTEFARTDEQRRIFTFLSNTGLTGNTFVAPPGVPEERLAALAEAYMTTLKDPAFVADAEKRHYTIEPLTRAEVTKAVRDILATPKAIVDRARAAMGLSGS